VGGDCAKRERELKRFFVELLLAIQCPLELERDFE
jgi:hypothetical protein